MKNSQIISRSKTVRFISPLELTQLIHADEVTYVEFEELIYFHYTFIKLLQTLRAKGKPLAVHIRSIDNNIFSINLVKESLTHFDSIDFIVDDIGGNFTLINNEVSLYSNTHFISRDINSHSEELIERRRSYYHTSLKRVSLSFSKYLAPDKLVQIIHDYQKKGKKVAVVTGIFDVLHPGHVLFLEKAKKTADVLIVLVNSDLSTNHQPKNRGHDRPVHRLHERVGVLNSLEFTTYIVPFDTDTALSILQSLPPEIIYVKTVKDKERKSIQTEINAVKMNGGKTEYISNLRNKSGSVISSTMLINACRKKASSKVIVLDHEWSETAKKKLQNLIKAIHAWDNSTGQITRMKEDLRSRYNGSLKTAISIELDVIDEITQITNDFIRDIEVERNYYSFVIPYLIGKILDFPIKIVPVQYHTTEPVSIINVAQRLGGRVIFFDTRLKKITKPFIFEKHYRFIDNHFQFVSIQPTNKFSIRIYAYTPLLHFLSLSLKILQEECEKKNQTLDLEMKETFGKIWEFFEGIKFNVSYSSETRVQSEYTQHLPKVIAHGGAAILSKKQSAAENSAKGIEYALAVGIDAVEIDINVCKDGWIVLHERDLSKETELAGFTEDYTEKELKKARFRFTKGKPSSEKIISVSDALKLVAKYKKNSSDLFVLKIDIKTTNTKLENKLIKTIIKSGLPPEKILVTSKLVPCSRRLHKMYPKFAYEFNAVDTNMLFYAYSLMNNTTALFAYVDYFTYYAPFLSSNVISLAQFMVNTWDEVNTGEFIKRLHNHGFQVHVWIATSLDEYFKNATLGADYVQLQNPKLIREIIKFRALNSSPESVNKLIKFHYKLS